MSTPRTPAKQRRMALQFPLGGLNRAAAYRQQSPFTTPSCLNVRPRAVPEGRGRGGSRPGLVRSHADTLAGSVRMLTPMTLALGDGFTVWSDIFSGTSLSGVWTQASWATAVPRVLSSSPLAVVDTSTDAGAVVRDALAIDSSETYAVEMFLAPWGGEHHGTYRLYLRLDDASPDIETDGVMVELSITGALGEYSGRLVTVTGGVETEHSLASGLDGSAEPGWLTVMVSGDNCTVYWRGAELLDQAVDSHSGLRVGFGLECTEDGGVCPVSVFRVQHYATTPVDELRSLLVASADGDLYREGFAGRMTAVSSSLSLRDDKLLTSAQYGQKLYIADYGGVVDGTDGTVAGTSLSAVGIADWTALGLNVHDYVVVISNPLGSATAGTYQIASIAAGSLTLARSAGSGGCAYRIERGPKVYDPAADTIAIWSAGDEAGQVPTGCPIVCRYLDRLVVAGENEAPHVWYMSRSGDPDDWDYSQTDDQRAVAGTSSEAGVPGDAITALVPHSDDYLIIGCMQSLWRLRGDPAYGGALDNLSRVAGIVGRRAWAFGPGGELVYLSRNGVYVLPPGGESQPIALSREVLPDELVALDTDQVEPVLEWDTAGHGIHIFLTSTSPGGQKHWWLDWTTKGFWPMSLDGNHEPTAICRLQATAIGESGVVLGGRDGGLRQFSRLSARDDGTAFLPYVVLGPIALAEDSQTGTILAMDAVLAEDSGPVTWAVRSALTFEGSLTASPIATGEWSAGLNASDHPRARGQAFCLLLEGAGAAPWAMEGVTVTVRESGRRRIP